MHSLHATSLWCRTPSGCMAFADIQTHQRLAQDSPVHLHPELTLQPFLHRRRSQQWQLTYNGTAPPCYLRSTGCCSNFSEISHSHHVASAVWFMLPSSAWSLLLNCLADSCPIWPHSLSVCQLSRDITVSPSYRRSHGMTWCSHLASKNAPYGHHQWVWRQLHESRMDSLLRSRIASPTYGDFLARPVWIVMVDNRHSRIQTGGRYYLPWRALSCIVALVSACLPWCCPHACFCWFFLCRLQGRLILFILIGVWNIVIEWYWPWQTVGFIWNCKQIAEHSNSWHLQYYVFRQGKGSSRIPCPDRIRLHILLFWYGNEICLRKMEHAARAHNHALSSDG